MKERGSDSRERVVVNLNNVIFNLVDKRKTSGAVFVLVLVFILGDVLVTATKRERGSEGGVMRQRGSASRKRVLVKLRIPTDERRTLDPVVALVPVLVIVVTLIVFVLGGVLVIATGGERGRERGDAKFERRGLSRRHWDPRLQHSQRENHGGSPMMPILPNGSFRLAKRAIG